MSFKLYEKEVAARGNLLFRKWLAKRFDLERPVAWRRSYLSCRKKLDARGRNSRHCTT